MKPYTVEVTWRVPEYTHLTVQANSPAQAIELALAEVANNPDTHERTLDHDCCGPDVITGLWEGGEPYPDPPGSTLPLPQTPERHLETAIEALGSCPQRIVRAARASQPLDRLRCLARGALTASPRVEPDDQGLD